MRWNGRASALTTASRRVRGCARKLTPSRAGPARSSSTSSPSGFSDCRARKISMPLTLNDEQNMLRDHARGFLNKNAPIAHFRQLRDSKDAIGFSRPLWKEFVDLGWGGILIPSPFLSTAVIAANAIARAGNDKQKSAYLPKIASGDLIATLAVDEISKHRPEKIALTATRSSAGYTLKGAKTFVLDGHVADLILVAARTSGTPGDTKGLTLF